MVNIDEGIMSIADETVIKVSKDDFIKKPIKSIKKLLRKRNKLIQGIPSYMECTGLFYGNKNLCTDIICGSGNN